MFASLRLPAFALLFAGRTIARLGDGIFAVAVAWWIVEHAGPQVRGGFLVASLLPTLVLLLFAGMLVDQLPRSGVLVISDIAHGSAIALTAVLAVQGRLTIAVLLVLAVVTGASTAFFYPAAQAVLPELVPAPLRASANSVNRISAELTGILGPPIGALAIAAIGTAGAFALDAATYALSAAAIIAIGKLPAPAPSAVEPLWRRLTGGVRVVVHRPWLWMTIVVAGTSNVTLAGPIDVSLPFLVKRDLHGDARLYGLLLAASAAGAVAVSVMMGRRPRIHHRGVVAYAGWLVSGLSLILTALVLRPAATVVAMLFFGGGIALLELVWLGSLQDPEIVPASLLGRVSAIDALGSYALLPIAFAVAGLATAAVGAPAVFLTGGLVSVAIIGIGLLSRGVREFD